MADSLRNESSFNFLPHLLISLMFYWRPTPLKSVTMATRNALFPIFGFQNLTDTYLGKFQFNCVSRLSAALKKPGKGAASAPLPPRLGLRQAFIENLSHQISQVLIAVDSLNSKLLSTNSESYR